MLFNKFYRKILAKNKHDHSEVSSAEIEKSQDKLKAYPDQTEEELNNYGKALLHSSKDEKAREVFQAMVRLHSDSPYGYAGLAMIAQKRKDWEKAIKYWDICLSINRAVIDPLWLVKKANALLKVGRFIEAEELFMEFRYKEPKKPEGYVGLAKVANELGNQRVELEKWGVVFDQFPDHSTGRMRYGALLRKAGRYEEAEDCFQYINTREPEKEDVLAALAWTASEARQYDLAVERWKDLAQRFPKDLQFQKMHIKSLLDILDFEQAQSIYDQHLAEDSPTEYLLLQTDIYQAQFEMGKALNVIHSLKSKDPNNLLLTSKKIPLLLKLFRSTGDSDYAEQALQELDYFKEKDSENSLILQRMIVILIQLNQKENALQLISKLPESSSKKNMELRAWASYMEGDTDHAKLLWKDISRVHHIPQIQNPLPGTLQQTDSNPVNITRDSIIVFTVVRNERWRLPWFLDYYRSLGCDRFIFVDNDSSDGTTEYLHEQKDVHVFWTNQSYAKAYSGMQWINWLVEQYGSDCWCLYVDVDEALIFPGAEKRGLRGITNYLVEKGQEAMFAFMLDMYAPGLQSTPKEENYKTFFADYPLFENQYFRTGNINCPYRYTTGGIRRTFNLNENQTKTPIIRGGRGIKFLMSSHIITPAIISDVTGVLLHFKLAGDFEHNFAQELIANTRTPDCKRRHWGYVQSLQHLPDDKSFISDHTVSYRSSQQLVDIGIIKTSTDFESGKYD